MELQALSQAYSLISEQKETYKAILNEVSLVHKKVNLLNAQKAKDKPTETSSEGVNNTLDPVL